MNEANQSRAKGRVGWVGQLFQALVVILVVMAVGSTCLYVCPETRNPLFLGEVTVTDVSERVSVHIPTSAELIGARDLGVVRPWFIAHVRIPADSLEEFKRNASVTFSSAPSARDEALQAMRLSTSRSWAWWTLPGIPKRFLCAHRVQQVERPPSTVKERLRIFIDLTARDHAEVYLHYFVDA